MSQKAQTVCEVPRNTCGWKDGGQTRQEVAHGYLVEVSWHPDDEEDAAKHHPLFKHAAE